MVPNVNILYRMLRVQTSAGLGSAFTIDRADRQFLVTARHVVPDEDPAEMVLTGTDSIFEVSLSRIPGVLEGADITAFGLPVQLTLTLPLDPSMKGLMLGQDVFFLGYPYGTAIAAPGMGTFPLVKKAALSAIQHEDGVTVMYLDGFNNPGFSGGRVVFFPQNSDQIQVAGVISGYRIDPLSVFEGETESEIAQVRANSGIIIAHSIEHSVEAIDAEG